MKSEFREGYVRCDHVILHYKSYGDGMPLIMLHGSMQNTSVFKNQVTFFKDKYRVITVDSRGHGQSSYGSKRLSIDVMSDDILAVMDTLQMEDAILLGFSDGGNIALKMASKAPTRVSALVVIGANIQVEGLRAFIRIPVKLGHGLLHLLRFIPSCDKLYQKIWLIAKEPNIAPDELHRIEAQTLCLAGRWDIVKEAHSRHIASEIKNAELKIVGGASHNLLGEKPNEINRLIQDFLLGLE